MYSVLLQLFKEKELNFSSYKRSNQSFSFYLYDIEDIKPVNKFLNRKKIVDLKLEMFLYAKIDYNDYNSKNLSVHIYSKKYYDHVLKICKFLIDVCSIDMYYNSEQDDRKRIELISNINDGEIITRQYDSQVDFFNKNKIIKQFKNENSNLILKIKK